MLPGPERGDCLLVVEERGRGEINEVHVLAPEERVDVLDVVDAEPSRRGECRRPMRPGHRSEFDPRDLDELLEREQPEPPAADDSQSDRLRVVHESRPRSTLAPGSTRNGQS